MQLLQFFVQGLSVLGGLFAFAFIVGVILLLRVSFVVMRQMAEENEAQ